jgi:UDP-GlcNAc:undecaprenyl-phosphate/decaprenyl-phosphate GlcNAc-1-phosphate transferase
MKNYSMLIAPLLAFLTGRLACSAVRRIALIVGFVDSPDRRRKLQEAPIPLGGGLAVWLATWSGLGVSLLGRSLSLGESPGHVLLYISLAIASFSILVLGLVDDRYGMRGLHKLAGQLASAAILVGMGLRIDAIGGFGIQLELGIFAYPVTFFWIILVVNAFNLIDGMDGFCAGVGSVALLAIAFLACWSGRLEIALISLALAGGLAAFLMDNLPPARIYLGDAGSMTIGLLISALSIKACSDGPGSIVSLPLLLAILALPLLDVVTALGRRWLTGHSLFMPDRGHIHHCLRNRLGSTAPALGIGVGLATVVACTAALAKTWQIDDMVSSLSIVTLVVLLVGTNLFGGSECRLLIYRLKMIIQGILANKSGELGTLRQECHLIGVRDWSKVWDGLIRSVEAAGGRRIELDIDLPSAGETYHGIWNVPAGSESQSNWSIVHSLEIGTLHAGTLRITGDVDASRDQYLDKVEKIVRDLQERLGEELHRNPNDRSDFPAPSPSQFPMPQLPGHGMARLVVRNPEG